MKIRNGFVSNSSSSSFVIQVNGAAEKCPTCGHAPESIVDMFKGGWDRYGGEDSCVEELGEYLAELEYELNYTKSHLAELLKRDPNELTYPNYRDSRTLVKQSIVYAKGDIAEIEKRIAKFQKAEAEGNKVYRLSLSYHDDFASHVFDENVKAGIVTVLEGEYQ